MIRFRKNINIVFIGLLIGAGLFIALKPMLDNWQNLQKQEVILQAIESGHETIEVILPQDDEDVDIYIDSLESDQRPIITPQPSPSLLNTVQGIGILAIDTIDLRLPVVEGIENAQLKVALGHLPSSADIGEVGNCIILGHRNYTYGEMFNRLNEVDVGDRIAYTDINGEVFEYTVYAVTVIDVGDNALFDVEENQRKLTLVTCTPVRKATHRLLVQAELLE